MDVDVCFSPALYPYYHRAEAAAVIVDIFRATTTLVAAFESGARSILPVASTEEAEAWKIRGWPVGAERNVCRCPFADFGNSPFDYTPEKVAGKEIVFTTTNGTKAIRCAGEAYRIVTGAFINLQAVADDCLRERRPVVVVCSGWENKINIEDTLFGGALVENLLPYGYRPAGDAARIALSLWKEAKKDLRGYLEQTEHIGRLRSAGLEDNIPFCLTLNRSSLLPVFSKKEGRLIIERNP
ncbi:MAG: 2-phosphosulfolactate phosphatase [Tannerella sp.]|jgi:2-phosphosulfolactate phosphatase|nr:2-phosphosulfolactate phosphatase [Tannerella sp.]